jgi:hypothetical protein
LELELEFTSVDVSWPGAVHEPMMWRNSGTCRTIRENTSHAILLADEGHGLTPWVTTPFRNPVTHKQQCYNNLHCREREIFERFFGQLKQWFPVFQNKMRLVSEQVPSIICCCFILRKIQIA